MFKVKIFLLVSGDFSWYENDFERKFSFKQQDEFHFPRNVSDKVKLTSLTNAARKKPRNNLFMEFILQLNSVVIRTFG